MAEKTVWAQTVDAITEVLVGGEIERWWKDAEFHSRIYGQAQDIAAVLKARGLLRGE